MDISLGVQCLQGEGSELGVPGGLTFRCLCCHLLYGNCALQDLTGLQQGSENFSHATLTHLVEAGRPPPFDRQDQTQQKA